MSECPDTYKCANCGEVNHKGWTDEKACKESERFFGVPNANTDECFVIVCDDCFQKMHPANHPEQVAQAKAELSRGSR